MTTQIALSAATYPVWSVTITLPASISFQYKFIRIEPNGTVRSFFFFLFMTTDDTDDLFVLLRLYGSRIQICKPILRHQVLRLLLAHGDNPNGPGQRRK